MVSGGIDIGARAGGGGMRTRDALRHSQLSLDRNP